MKLIKIALIIVLVFLCFIVIYKKLKPINSVVAPPVSVSPDNPSEPTYSLPEFVEFPAVRSVNKGGKILSDIESHLPAGHIYGDPDLVTNSHEGTHGVNSAIRQKYPGCNAVYCLSNKAIVNKEPPFRLSTVANIVPKSLRGDVYKLYLIDQQRYWAANPLYIFDEFSAYSNGTMTGIENNLKRSESTKYMTEFIVYALCVVKATNDVNNQVRETGQVIVPEVIIESEKSKIIEKNGVPVIVHPTASHPIKCSEISVRNEYDDSQLKSFVRWYICHVLEIIKNSANTNMQSNNNILETLRTSADANELREFTRRYFSPEWTREYLQF